MILSMTSWTPRHEHLNNSTTSWACHLEHIVINMTSWAPRHEHDLPGTSCMHTCMHACIYTYIHTHIQTHFTGNLTRDWTRNLTRHFTRDPTTDRTRDLTREFTHHFTRDCIRDFQRRRAYHTHWMRCSSLRPREENTTQWQTINPTTLSHWKSIYHTTISAMRDTRQLSSPMRVIQRTLTNSHQTSNLQTHTHQQYKPWTQHEDQHCTNTSQSQVFHCTPRTHPHITDPQTNTMKRSQCNIDTQHHLPHNQSIVQPPITSHSQANLNDVAITLLKHSFTPMHHAPHIYFTSTTLT